MMVLEERSWAKKKSPDIIQCSDRLPSKIFDAAQLHKKTMETLCHTSYFIVNLWVFISSLVRLNMFKDFDII